MRLCVLCDADPGREVLLVATAGSTGYHRPRVGWNDLKVDECESKSPVVSTVSRSQHLAHCTCPTRCCAGHHYGHRGVHVLPVPVVRQAAAGAERAEAVHHHPVSVLLPLRAGAVRRAPHAARRVCSRRSVAHAAGCTPPATPSLTPCLAGGVRAKQLGIRLRMCQSSAVCWARCETHSPPLLAAAPNTRETNRGTAWLEQPKAERRGR